MEDITKYNYKEKFSEIEKSIKTANFISIDSEFSGMVFDSKFKNSLFDVGKDRYEKYKKNIEKFIALQVGITTYHFNRDTNEYTAKVYNFHIFPRHFATVDSRFLCQASSWAFLSEFDFDFNKCVRDGLPFLNSEQEEQLKEDLKSDMLLIVEDNLSISMDNERTLQRERSRVGEWLLEDSKEQETMTISYGLLKNDEALFYYFQKEIRHNYDNVWTKILDQDIEVRKVSREERERLEREDKNGLDEWIVDTMLGFTKVFRLLVDAKKPIVGHNLMLDLMILYNQFHKPLPNSYTTFKKKITELFPIVYDTKFISYRFKKNLEFLYGENALTSNVLKPLYEYFKNTKITNPLLAYAPEVSIDAADQSQIDAKLKSSYHMAGWDSYVTGYCFIMMGHYFATLKYGAEGIKRPLSSTEHISGVSEWRCKVNVIRASINHIIGLPMYGYLPSSMRKP
ncbi:pre-piRNA 3'-exonuclease trimmer [Nilaparvata lugens]|uniref:pre-piRNA 3'-exonuclease trimmer n=1 Tax=Nilaparvata lugens TaxID=108931 RepID=UPI00193CCDB0|nr:pre-piRNA 3'-exonuclease trimmer [Nilaparvata lugens]